MIFRPSQSVLARAFSVTARSLLQEEGKKLLRVAIIGAPNAGKSTLLNRLIQAEVSCVSNKVHTTRSNVLGVYTEGLTQVEFFDSPGVVARHHLLKHKLEDSLLVDPKQAALKCDLVAVVIDASNIREQKRLNRGIIDILTNHADKSSILILNKVDLVKDKRTLLDIGTRLTQGCLNGHLTIEAKEIRRMEHRELEELNLTAHSKSYQYRKQMEPSPERQHRFVIELSSPRKEKTQPIGGTIEPDLMSYKNFSRIFSISALNDDGIDELREYMLDLAKPVEKFPHSPDYLTNQSGQAIVGSIVRGRFMDCLPSAIPYTLKYDFRQYEYDNMGALHVNLIVVCPSKYAIGQVIGERGAVITRVIGESRDAISRALGCDVKLTLSTELHKSKRK